MKIPSLSTNYIHRTLGRSALLLVLLLLACLALSPQVRATCQQACLTNQNTADGEDALLTEKTGSENTAVGYHALNSQDGRNENTGVGANALAANIAGYANTAVGADALSVSTYTHNNTAVGYAALSGNFGVGDSDNVALGYR